MSKPRVDPTFGISSVDVLIPSDIRHVGGAKLNQALVRNVRTWPAMPREKAQASNREAESTDAPGRGGLLRSSEEAGVMLVERREQAIAIWLGSTGNGRNPMFKGRRQPSRDGTSRMTRECHVRFREGLGVKFPGPTRQQARTQFEHNTSAYPPIADMKADIAKRRQSARTRLAKD